MSMKICGVKTSISEFASGLTVFFGRHRKSLLYGLFVIVSLICGLTYAYLLPFGQVPDELAHYEMIEEEFGTEGYYNQLQDVLWIQGGYEDVKWHPDVKVNAEAVASIKNTRFSHRLALSDFHPSIRIFRHLPAGIGFYLGIALDLPILSCTYLAELFSVLFFVGMGLLTIKTAPVKKEIFAFCLLIPETLQQCASVSYDSVTIPITFLLFAYILHLYERDKSVQWKQISVVIFMVFVLLVTKPPYALVMLTLFMIPSAHYDLRIGKKTEAVHLIKKYWYIVLTLIILIGGLGVYHFRDTSIMKTIIADILSIGDFARMLVRTFNKTGYETFYMMVGEFGWLDSRGPESFLLLFTGMLVCFW